MTRDVLREIACAAHALDDHNRRLVLAMLLHYADLHDDEYCRGLVFGVMTRPFLSAWRTNLSGRRTLELN